MIRSLKTLQRAAAVTAAMLALVPLAGDLHFATTKHRWCPIHHHIEDVSAHAAQAAGPTGTGVSQGHSAPADSGQRCPVLVAMRPSTRSLSAAVTVAPPAPPATHAAPPAAPRAVAVLERAPKHGPPAA